MRFDKKVEFVDITRVYDASTGDYTDSVVVKHTVMADVTDASTKAMQIAYGELRQGAKVIRLQNPIIDIPEKVRYNSKYWRIDAILTPSNRQAYVVSEIMSNVQDNNTGQSGTGEGSQA